MDMQTPSVPLPHTERQRGHTTVKTQYHIFQRGKGAQGAHTEVFGAQFYSAYTRSQQEEVSALLVG